MECQLSHNLTFATKIKDWELLAAACDRMRERCKGHELTGPHYKENVPVSSGRTLTGYAVRLPGWSKDALFACDAEGTMDADNYSSYSDDREIDKAGNRVPGSGQVHPDVLSGAKRVGEDGQWGDIKYLEMLEDEYIAAGYEDVASSQGHQFSSEIAEDGAILLEIEV